MSVLTDQNGFPIASAAKEGQDPEIQAAVAALVHKSVVQVHAHLGMGKSDLVQLSDEKGWNLVIRTFSIKNQELILTVLIPDRTTPFKKVTRQGVKDITRIWNDSVAQ
jgi:predicted regulator of Ras-like GTPase activity (Roadblock/LC7/MglB family)